MDARDSDLFDVVTRDGSCIPRERKSTFKDSVKCLAVYAHCRDICAVTAACAQNLPGRTNSQILDKLGTCKIESMRIATIDTTLFPMLMSEHYDSSDYKEIIIVIFFLIIT